MEVKVPGIRVWVLFCYITLQTSLSYAMISPAVSCEANLNAELAIYGPSGSRDRVVNSNTVKLSAILPSDLGEESLLLERTGQHWESQNIPKGTAANQGDPRWIVDFLGAEAASFFRIYILSEKFMQVPGAKLLNRLIELLNSTILKSEEKIPVRFYDQTELENNDQTFLKRMVEEGSLPIARFNPFTVHDIAYHLSILIMPPKYFELVRRQAQAFLHFQEFVKSYDQDLFRQEAIQFVFNQLATRYSKFFDVGSGNLSPSLIAPTSPAAASEQVFSIFNSRGHSPKETLIAELNKNENSVYSYKSPSPSLAFREIVLGNKSDFNFELSERLNRALEKFITVEQSRHAWFSAEPEFGFYYKHVTNLRSRIAFIREKVAEFNKLKGQKDSKAP